MINVLGCFTLLSSQVPRPSPLEPTHTRTHPHTHTHTRTHTYTRNPPHLSVLRAQWYAHRLLHKMGKDCGHNHGPSANCGSDLLKP